MRVLLPALLATAAVAFVPSTPSARQSAALQATRKEFLTAAAGAAFVAAVPAAAFAAETTMPSGVTYTVVKNGNGPKPEIGELAAIRFAAYAGSTKIDDIFDTPEPYYTRIGNGGLIKGVEEVLPLMRVGDRWKLVVPPSMAFGAKGRPASAGKPRISGETPIDFEVEMVGLPGKEQELIDIIGD